MRARAQERGGGRARCVIKTLIIQSITNAIIGGRADGRGWDFRSCRDSAGEGDARGGLSGMGGYSYVGVISGVDMGNG